MIRVYGGGHRGVEPGALHLVGGVRRTQPGQTGGTHLLAGRGDDAIPGSRKWGAPRHRGRGCRPETFAAAQPDAILRFPVGNSRTKVRILLWSAVCPGNRNPLAETNRTAPGDCL